MSKLFSYYFCQRFFNDLYEFVLKCEEKDKKVIMSGLDGDSNRKPFGQILNCIPLCDSVVKLTAMDMIDKDGSEAIFSLRKKNTQPHQSQLLEPGRRARYQHQRSLVTNLCLEVYPSGLNLDSYGRAGIGRRYAF